MERPTDLKDLIPKGQPSEPPQGVKDIEIPLKDGSLPARIYLCPEVGPSLFFFHAEKETIDHYDTLGSYLNFFGISLIVIGYKGSNNTKGDPSFETIFQDALEAFDYLKTFLENRGRRGIIALLGRSLGAAIALTVATERIKSVSALILDSPIIDSKKWLTYHQIYNENFSLFSPLEYIKKWRKALLIFQAQFDKIFSLPEAEKFLIFCPGRNKRLLIMPGYKREETIERGGKLYAETIAELLNRMGRKFKRTKSLH